MQRLTAAQAVALIRPDDWVSLSQAEPETLVQAILDDRERLRGLRLLVAPILGSGRYAAPDAIDFFAITAIYVGPPLRRVVAAGQVDYIPTGQVELFRLVEYGYLAPSVLIVHVAEPDAAGNYSLGLMADWNHAAADQARLVIAQVNSRMPRTAGNNYLRADQIDVIVEAEEALPEVPIPDVGPVEEQIGRHVASLVPDGATLETGIGAIPAAVAQALAHHHDLGIHTAMFTDSLRDLYLKGAITGRHKEIDAGRMIAASATGTTDLYTWLHDNPLVEIHPPSYCHSPATLAHFKTLIALNSAIEVDLAGQVNAEAIAGSVISTVGGGVDFSRGAMAAPNGKSILALPSTAGRYSRIVPAIQTGQPVTYARHDVQYIVTEYGIADLRGRTLRDRAALIAELAHPDYRDELREAARRLAAGPH